MSQFDGLLEIKTRRKEPPKKKPSAAQIKPPDPPSVQRKPDERSPGKSNNPVYTQTSIYIKRDTQISVKSSLLTDQKNRDFSDLVEELLTDWLRNQK
jgi:hypothetical protein